MAADSGASSSAAASSSPDGPTDAGQHIDAERLGELRFLTVAEVATLMRVSKMTVYRLVNAATLPAVRVGRSVRVPEQAVHDYLEHSFVEAG
jgi:excisionase family DNA binding protein